MQRLGVIAIFLILIYSLFWKKCESGDTGVFRKLLQEAQAELYPGCSSTTRLSFILRMLHGKTKNHMTNRAFDFVFGELNFFMPAEMKLPKSYAEAKRVLSEIGMGYETIDIFKYDCSLFGEYHASSTHCPECGHSR